MALARNQSGLLYLIPALCARTRTNGPAPARARALATPHQRKSPGSGFFLKADERFATAWQLFLPLGIEQSSTNPVDSLLSTDVRFGTHSGLKSDIWARPKCADSVAKVVLQKVSKILRAPGAVGPEGE